MSKLAKLFNQLSTSEILKEATPTEMKEYVFFHHIIHQKEVIETEGCSKAMMLLEYDIVDDFMESKIISFKGALINSVELESGRDLLVKYFDKSIGIYPPIIFTVKDYINCDMEKLYGN